MLRTASLWALAWALAVATPAGAAAPEIFLEKKSVVLGDQPQLEVRVKRGQAPGTLRGAASWGELSPGEPAGPGELRYVWTLPQTRIPTVALLLFWVEDDDTPPDVGVARVALVGRTELEIDTEPRASIRVRVGTGVFGPVQADERGKAKVAVEVPPGVGEARVLGEREGGKETEVTVPLGVPPSNPLFAILGPSPLYSDGRGWLWVFDASDFYADKLQVVLKGGDARMTVTTRQGTLFEITPAPRSRRITATATAKGNPLAKAQAATTLVQGPRPPPSTSPPAAQGGGPPQGTGATVGQTPPQIADPLQVRTFAQSFTPGALIGGFYGGGGNLGFAASVQLGYRLSERWGIDLELGVRRAAMATVVPLGRIESAMTALPLLAAGRFRGIAAGPWTVDLRAGGGAMPFVHVATSQFQPTFSETGLGWDAFAGAEIGYRLGAIGFFLDVRATYSPASTPRVDSRMGGMFFALGARSVP